MRTTATLLTLIAWASGAAAGVLQVPADHHTVQLAVDASAPGDTVLIAPGEYAERVVVERALSLVADGGDVRLGRLIVRNLPLRETVVVRGIDVTAGGGFFPPGTALELTDNAGPVRLEDATLRGSGGYGAIGQPGAHPSGFVGVRVENCASVVFTRCTLTGGTGTTVYDEYIDLRGQGASALSVDGADVSVHGGSCTGGDGGSILDTLSIDGGWGGHGIEARNATLFVEGALLAGGDGGDADCDFIACGFGGFGGSGASIGDFAGNPTDGIFRDATFSPGAGGRDGDWSGYAPDGQDVLVAPGSSETHLPVPWRDFTASSPERAGSTATLTWDAQAGDELFTWLSVGTTWAWRPAHDGVFLVDTAVPLNILLFAANAPTDGELSAVFVVPALGPEVDDLTLFWQGIVRRGAEWYLGPVSVATLLDEQD